MHTDFIQLFKLTETQFAVSTPFSILLYKFGHTGPYQAKRIPIPKEITLCREKLGDVQLYQRGGEEFGAALSIKSFVEWNNVTGSYRPRQRA